MSTLSKVERAKLVREGVLLPRPRGRPKGTGEAARIKALRRECGKAVARSNAGERVLADILGMLGTGF